MKNQQKPERAFVLKQKIQTMCLYPKLILNPKYLPNKRNKRNPPKVDDERKKYVAIGCQRCQECLRQKSNSWKIRLYEEIKSDKTGIFITLTFSDQSILTLTKDLKEHNYEGYQLDNAIATLATRRFLERHRKKYRKALKHFLITELGHTGTENIHLHGILFTQLKTKELEELWHYGFIWNGYDKTKTYVNEETINYITKYITKVDKDHTEYRGKILTSPAIGANYINTPNARQNTYNETKTKETYTTKTGHKQALPIYYRNKLFTEKQRENLWTKKLDENTRYIGKLKFNMNNENEARQFYLAQKEAQRQNIILGYGNDEANYDEKKYQEEQRKLMNLKRIERATKADSSRHRRPGKK